MRRNLLLSDTRYVASRRWATYVNTIAASPLVGHDHRKAIYRFAGMDISEEAWTIGPRCYFHSFDMHIGARTIINDYCHFENVAPITLGSGVGIGTHTVIITSNHDLGPSSQRNGRWFYEPVTIEDGCWIGARSTILPGVTIGRGCMIGAGALVTKDCESDSLYAGVPARFIRRLDEPAGDDPRSE